MNRSRLFIVVAALGVMCLTVACATAQAPEQAAPSTETSAATSTETSTETTEATTEATTAATPSMPKSGGVFNVPVTDDIQDMDMSYTGSTNTNATPIKLGYSYLMRMKTSPDIAYSENVIEPLLAERWEVSPDASTYTFYLRKGVKFADLPPVNGRELTAEDVKWSFEYSSRTGAVKDAGLRRAQFGFLFEGMESITVVDPYTVSVKFEQGFAPFLTYAASSDNLIMPHEIYDEDGHFQDRLVGSGPFIPDLEASQKGTIWVLKKNPTYFEEGKPYLDQVNLIVLKDDATLQAAFTAKQVDYYLAPEFRAADEVRTNVSDAVEYSYPNVPKAFYLHFKRPPLNDPKVRLAFSRAIDRDDFIKTLEGGFGEWAIRESNVFAGLFTKEEIHSIIKYDPEEAKQLLIEAGFPDGLTVKTMYTGNSQTATKAVELFQAQLKRVNINLELEPLDRAEVTKRKRARDFDTYWAGEAPRTDLDGSLNLAVHPTGAFNFNDIDDPKVTALLADQRSEADPVKRRELHREVLQYMNENAILNPTWRGTRFIFKQPYLKGWHHQADYRQIGSIWNTWLDK